MLLCRNSARINLFNFWKHYGNSYPKDSLANTEQYAKKKTNKYNTVHIWEIEVPDKGDLCFLASDVDRKYI